MGLVNVSSGIIGSINKEFIEKISSPLDAVLNLRWEISKCAHGNGFLGRILRVSVALSLVRDNHLRVSLGTEGARLEKRFLVPDAASVDIEASLYVVNSIDNEIETLPEGIVKHVFGLLRHIKLVVLHI